MRIFKFILRTRSTTEIALPDGARVLSVEAKHGIASHVFERGQ